MSNFEKYEIDGVEYDRVTTIIGGVWGKRSAPSYRVAAGTDAHTFLEALANGRDDFEPTSGYQAAVLQFVKDTNFTVIESEARVWHPWDGYAGTADLVVRDGRGFLGIIDLKTRRTIWEKSFLTDRIQVQAYKAGWNYGGIVPGRPQTVSWTGVLLAHDDGTYNLDLTETDVSVWQATLDLYRALEAAGEIERAV